MISRRFIRAAFAGASALLAGAAAAPASAAWEPSKSIEIVVAAGPGGASDQMARMLQAAIQKHNLLKQPVVVSLKGGASGAEALMYMKASDDPHKFLIAYSLIYTLPLAAKIPFDWRNLTPVSILAFDQFGLWVNAGSPYKTVKDFTDAMKAAPSPMKVGGTGSRREDHILSAFLEKRAGAKLSYLPYKSGGEAATQLVGNHIAANFNNPSENLEIWRAGQARALCIFDDERISYTAKVAGDLSWHDIPTCKEQGLDIEYTMLRAMFLPAKASPDQVAFYEDLFRKITQTPEFKDYMEKQALKPAFMTGAEMVRFLERDEALHKQLMGEAGFVATN